MNDKIRELAIQAKLHSPLILQYWGKIEALTDSEQEELENIEKFAQLIVAKCVSVAYKYDEPKLSGPGLMIGNMIEYHFGAEE